MTTSSPQISSRLSPSSLGDKARPDAVMTWEATASIVAVTIAVATFLFSYLTWRTERRERKDAVAEERSARLAEQTDVVPVVTLVRDPHQTGVRYWRLQLSGGNAFSRVYVTSMTWHPGTGLAFEGKETHVLGGSAGKRGLWMLAGQRSHLRFDGSDFGSPDDVVVTITWSSDPLDADTSPNLRWMAIAVEPWG
jgi:hypothetical protein